MAESDNKLDQALGEIIQRENAPRRRTQQRRSAAAPKAPAGGVQKNRAPPHRRVVSQPARASSWKSDRNKIRSKALVSNMPYDVTEDMIKEYFDDTVGDVVDVEIHYGPDGKSRGKADISFSSEGGASLALSKLNEVKIDNRHIKIEIIGAKADAPKPISERATQPKREKVQPKSAADVKDKSQQARAKNAGGVKKNPPRRAARNARPAKKTAEELDLEMADYFVGNNNAEEEGDAAPPATTGGDDAAMDDEIS